VTSLASLSLLASLAGCRASPEPPVASKAVAPLATDPVHVAPTDGLAALKAAGEHLKVAADPDAAPFLSKTPTGYEGYEWALADAIAQGAGLSVEIVPGTFTDLPSLVSSGAADVGIGQLSPSSAYSGLGWSVSYLQYSLCLVTPAGSPIHHMADLKGKKVGMYDDPVARQLTSALVGASFDQVLFDDYGYFEKMVRGGLDAMVYDCPLARYEMKTYGDKLAIADDSLDIATYNVAVREDDPKLLSDVNASLKSLGESGLLAQLEQRWLGETARTGSYETAAGKVVVVAKGDSLSSIAGRELGAVDKWKGLYEANKDVVGPDPDVVYAGMRLRVPR
jgi:polar amino acid transport system substrate-binding protein